MLDTTFDENEIIAECQEFLTKSSTRYSGETVKQINDLECFNGHFWDEPLIKKYGRGRKKFNLHFSDWSVLCNAIVSPYSNSPWHIQLNDTREQYEQIQDLINQLEGEEEIKFELKKALTRAVVCGAGYVVVTTDLDEVTGQPKIVAEFVQRQGSVALDPMCDKLDASDAEQGAIVNYISCNKAKRLYGSDVLPYDYPNAMPKLNFSGLEQWPVLSDKVQVVSYYKKNEVGNVDYYKICGNKVLEHFELPIKYIPIIRFAGYEKYNSDGIKYSGIVDKTWNLQLGLNIAYSTLMERANRSIKANIIMSTKAGQNLEPYYQKKEDEDGSVIMYNQGADVPQVITEQFQTGDLTQVIENTRTLIADVIGIPLAGVLGNEDKTATEILIQQNNKESNVSMFYDNAFKATKTFGKIVIELITGGMELGFSLQNGPDVITNNLKHRQELNAIAQLMPPEMQPLVALHMCNTVDSNFIEGVKNDLIANLSTQMKLVSEQPSDPVAIHQLNQMQEMLDNTMLTLEQIQQENQQLKQENAQMSLALTNQKEKLDLELLKHNDQYGIDLARLELDAEKQDTDIAIDTTMKQAQLAKDVMELENKKLDIVQNLAKGDK